MSSSLLSSFKPESVQHLEAILVVEELLRLGVSHFVLSPGARAIPLIMAIKSIERQAGRSIEVVTINDERSAAFFAQGISKAGGFSCLICTSGTAVANYYPAVVEAFYSKTPLLIVSTDRPWELQNANANQTIAQDSFFGIFVGTSISIPAPDKNIYPHSLLSNVDQLVRIAIEERVPTHLNLAFRKPFYQDNFSIESNILETELELIDKWLKSQTSYVRLLKSRTSSFKNEISIMQDMQSVGIDFSKIKKIAVVAGPMGDKSTVVESNILNLAVPVLADIRSNLRSEADSVFGSYYEYLDKFGLELKPDLVFLLGGRIVSEELVRFISQEDVVIVQVSDENERIDAIENTFIPISFKISSADFVALSRGGFKSLDSSYLAHFKELDEQAKIEIGNSLDLDRTTERQIISKAVSKLDSKWAVFLSASLIFREADRFLSKVPKGLTFYSNPGATGIDGIISSALGVSVGSGGPLLCIIGDQAALHDLTALSLLNKLGTKVIVLLINNNGGAIFNFFDQRDILPSLINSHGLNFANFAKGFGLDYVFADSVEAFASSYSNIVEDSKSYIIEVCVDGVESVENFKSKGLNK